MKKPAIPYAIRLAAAPTSKAPEIIQAAVDDYGGRIVEVINGIPDADIPFYCAVLGIIKATVEQMAGKEAAQLSHDIAEQLTAIAVPKPGGKNERPKG